ncbi:hypothetical protein FO519_006962 [Halicephalobus sp. NKZ332]|nr:hypothetical protein FO519_006962 [Halicephalobus sp. NKZ332]
MELEQASQGTLESQEPQAFPTGSSGRKSYQLHRRASSKWVPLPAPIIQRIIQPIQQRFERQDDQEQRIVEPNWKDSKTPRYLLKNYKKFCDNKISTTKYTVWNFFYKNLYDQMHRWANLYFIGIVILNWCPAVQAFSKYLGMIPVIIILGLTMLKDGFEDFRRHRADNRINEQTVHVWSSEYKKFRKMPWKYIIVGDLVHVSVDETVPADLLLIRSSDSQGGVFVETSNLDGENNLKQKSVLPNCRKFCEVENFDPTSFDLNIYCNKPDSRLNYIHGSVHYGDGTKDRIGAENMVIRGCQVRNTTFVEGVVMYTGKETKAMLNTGSIPYKRSTLERATNLFIVYCVILLAILCISGGGLSIRWYLAHDVHKKNIPYIVLYTSSALGDGIVNMVSFIISYQTMIPLSLYITVEIIKLGQIFFLNSDLDLYYSQTDKRILCRSFTIAEELGQIQYILSDKTGTLTENKMIFKCCSIMGNAYEPSSTRTPTLPGHPGCQVDQPVDNQSNNSLEDEPIEVNESLKSSLFRVAMDPNCDEIHQAYYYFFLNLTLCNTVMVHSHKHQDKINNGYMEGGIFYVANSSFFLRSNEYPVPDSTPTSGTLTNVQTPVSSKFAISIPSAPEIVRKLSSFFRKKERPFSLQKMKTRRVYEAESPDEYCLVNAARAYGFVLQHRGIESVEFSLPLESPETPDDWRGFEHQRRIKLKIAKVLHFDANRKRMSIILDYDDKKLLLCKGADHEILGNLSPEFCENLRGQTIINNSKLQLERYASDGLRTLCMAMKWISNEEYDQWLNWHERIESSDDSEKEENISQSARSIEKNMELLGLTAIEDRLQDGVPETISSLRRAGIQVWVLTGDKEETALNIARSCQLFENGNTLCLKTEEDILRAAEIEGRNNIVVSPRMVKFLENKDHPAISVVRRAAAVLCYRMTPSEKASISEMVKKALGGKVLAVGDGANDVPMILSADVGIGISGQEGLQAVMSSDFALARFKYLKKLLLVHGHWFYYRLANVLLYFLCKNATLVLVIYWAQFFSGFSANGVMDPLYMMLYPIIFTVVQPLAFGILDQDIEEEALMREPHLYSKGRNGTVYKSANFFLNIADAIWQSAAIYFISFGAYWDTDCEAWDFGFVLASALFFCNNGHLALMTRCWTSLTVVLHLFFIAVHYCFFFTYTSFSAPIFGTKSTPAFVAVSAINTFTYWGTLFLCIIVALLPRFFFKVLQNTVRPGIVFQAALKNRRPSSFLPCCIPGCGF